MDKTVYFNNLYDCYQSLLTSKQQQYFEDYYFQNLSFREMADNYQISPNAIHHQLKLVEKKLEDYEEKLQLHRKREEILILLRNQIDTNLEQKIKDLL